MFDELTAVPEADNLASARTGEVLEVRRPEDIGRSELRMWLFVRKDLPMPPGKLAAQSGHGFSTCLWLAQKRDADLVETYMSHAQGKIAVGVKNEAELLSAVAACREAGLVAVTVRDAAHTVFDAPVLTVGAVGPCYREQLPRKVSRLRLFSDYAAPEA